MRLHPDERGYAMTWWAGFYAFVLLPLLALSIGLGRYAIAASEVQAAADMAALAAARDVEIGTYEGVRDVRFSHGVYSRAERYANVNTDYLAARGIHVSVEQIAADSGSDRVRVGCVADVSRLFPAVMPQVVIRREGTTAVRMRVRP